MVSLHYNGLNGILEDEVARKLLIFNIYLYNIFFRILAKLFKPFHSWFILNTTEIYQGGRCTRIYAFPNLAPWIPTMSSRFRLCHVDCAEMNVWKRLLPGSLLKVSKSVLPSMKFAWPKRLLWKTLIRVYHHRRSPSDQKRGLYPLSNCSRFHLAWTTSHHRYPSPE